jgi:hypothetical protein
LRFDGSDLTKAERRWPANAGHPMIATDSSHSTAFGIGSHSLLKQDIRSGMAAALPKRPAT